MKPQSCATQTSGSKVTTTLGTNLHRPGSEGAFGHAGSDEVRAERGHGAGGAATAAPNNDGTTSASCFACLPKQSERHEYRKYQRKCVTELAPGFRDSAQQ